MTAPAILHTDDEARALIGFGQVRHARLRPRQHEFSYGTWFLMLPMHRLHDVEAMGGLAVNRPAAVSFHEQDHGDGRSASNGGAVSWLQQLLHGEGIDDADGEIWLHTYPRVLGYTFKPVSFWYCHNRDGGLRAIVAEVNNTFGERHCYLLDRPRPGTDLLAAKHFHVSPFCQMNGQYRFRFMNALRGSQPHTVMRVEYEDPDGPLLRTSVSGALQPVTPALLKRALWRYPAMTMMVMARIHWQALQLAMKRVAFHRKPAPPDQFLTR